MNYFLDHSLILSEKRHQLFGLHGLLIIGQGLFGFSELVE